MDANTTNHDMTSPTQNATSHPLVRFLFAIYGYRSYEAGAHTRDSSQRFRTRAFPGSVAISSNHCASRSLTSFACDTRNQCPPGISTASLPGPLARTSRNHRLP